MLVFYKYCPALPLKVTTSIPFSPPEVSAGAEPASDTSLAFPLWSAHSVTVLPLVVMPASPRNQSIFSGCPLVPDALPTPPGPVWAQSIWGAKHAVKSRSAVASRRKRPVGRYAICEARGAIMGAGAGIGKDKQEVQTESGNANAKRGNRKRGNHKTRGPKACQETSRWQCD